MFPDTNKIYRLSKSFLTFGELADAAKKNKLLLEQTKKRHYDALVVLSHQVDSEGSLSDLTKNRIERGCQLFSAGAADFMIMAGRDMHTGKDLPLVKLMWEYAFELGIPRLDKDKEENIKVNIEPKGTDTIMQLFCFIRDHVMKKKRESFIVVTDDYQALGKAIPYCAFIAGEDFEVGYAMSNTFPIFKNHKSQQAALEKQFSSLDMAKQMFRGIGAGIKNHGGMLKRIFQEHERYKGQLPSDYLINIPDTKV